MTPETLLNDLEAVLREEIALHAGLRDELAAELEQDGALDSKAFIALQRRKYSHVTRIEAQESRRIAKVGELALHWDEAADSLTLRHIVARVPEAVGERLADCHAQLVALVEEIRELARETGSNAQARLKAVEATLQVVGEAARLHPTYSGRGRLQQKPPTFKSTSA